MIRRIRDALSREMIRPLIYKVFTRGILALFAAQLAHFFLPPAWHLANFSNLSLLLGGLFALCAVLAWLRLDGLKIPQMKMPRLKRKEPPFLAGDMADHLDDDIVTFDELDEEEQNVCVLLADVLLAVICLVLASIV